ncbi:MAG TPA: hypothetical protein VJZ04_11770 [Lachnospiraceae bacterium]|nr:hypothetical protein [Lachnospiraceae bacterium]
MNQLDWMSDSSLSHIPKAKLEFLQKMVFDGKNLTQKEMLPFLLSITKFGKDNNIQFSKEEMDAIVLVLRKHSTPEEINKINKIMSLRK